MGAMMHWIPVMDAEMVMKRLGDSRRDYNLAP
jgi:hypothetical protein